MGAVDVWTGTGADGTQLPPQCQGWTSSDSGATGRTYFLDGQWQKLVSLYDTRLANGEIEDAKERASLLHRVGQILETAT